MTQKIVGKELKSASVETQKSPEFIVNSGLS